MVNRHRNERAGAWHHVMNRGIARRTVIENTRDADQFLDCILMVVEDGLLEVHAYSLMPNHFHLLVYSPCGELSLGLKRLQNRYSRYFNRARRRDGPLWRGRFLSKAIETSEYWSRVVRYIDFNPVRAGLAIAPSQYPFGSAWHYARHHEGPAWLCRAKVEQIVSESSGRKAYVPHDYEEVFSTPLSASGHWMIERHGFSRNGTEAAFTDLVGAAPIRVRKWMERKAHQADGTSPGVGVLAPEDVLRGVSELRANDPGWTVRPRSRNKPGWQAVACAVLSHTSGMTMEEIASAQDIGRGAVERHLKEHAGLLVKDEKYAERVSELVVQACRAGYPREYRAR